MSSCSFSSFNTEEPISTGFECDADITYRDMQIKGHLTRRTAGTLSIDITEPSSLNGMTMIWDGENIALKMYGIAFDMDPAKIPESALGTSILDALDMVTSKDGGNVTNNGVLTIGSGLNGEFQIVSDPETGHLRSMEIPSLNLTASFSNFQLLDR